jgi:hypothetical protein
VTRHASQDSWIGRTGQGWKVVVFLLLAFLDLCVFGLGTWRANRPTNLPFFPLDVATLGLSFAGLSVVTFAWLWFSIRCPDCKKSVVGRVLRNSTASDWWPTLVTLPRCPYCGSSGRPQKNSGSSGNRVGN